jgi:hypothetical protein
VRASSEQLVAFAARGRGAPGALRCGCLRARSCGLSLSLAVSKSPESGPVIILKMAGSDDLNGLLLPVFVGAAGSARKRRGGLMTQQIATASPLAPRPELGCAP